MNERQCRAYQAVMGLAIRHMPLPSPLRVCGAGSVGRIPGLLEERGSTRPLLVTGPRLAKGPAFGRLVQSLDECRIFTEVEADPTTETAEIIAGLYRRQGCDAIVALGGGSNMDAAKAAAARIARPNKSFARLGGTFKVLRRTPLLIAVPTTAGTGSECTVAAVVRDATTGHKYAINDPSLVPDIAVLDPELTTSLPARLTAATGMDALTHAVEAYLNRTYHQKDTAALCEEAVGTILRWLPVAVEQPHNLEAREAMLEASSQAGRAFTVACVGNVHAAAHTIGGLYRVPHGEANAALLPVVLEDYGDAVTQQLALLARVAGLQGTDDAEASQALIGRIREMNEAFGLPSRFEAIREEDLPQMCSWAVKEANPLYPVPVVYDEERFERVLRAVSAL